MISMATTTASVPAAYDDARLRKRLEGIRFQLEACVSQGDKKSTEKGEAYSRKTTMPRLQQKPSLGETATEKLKQLWSKFSDTVGGKKLYHCTSEQNAESIERSGFRPGSRGIVGGGI
jgi:hypothetical protein